MISPDVLLPALLKRKVAKANGSRIWGAAENRVVGWNEGARQLCGILPHQVGKYPPPPPSVSLKFRSFRIGEERIGNEAFGNLRHTLLFVFVQELGEFHAVILFVIIRFETYFFAEHEHDVFLHRRTKTVDLKGIILKGETATVVGFARVFDGKQGIKVEACGKRREGGPLPAGQLPSAIKRGRAALACSMVVIPFIAN
jgi:hypothetical protein